MRAELAQVPLAKTYLSVCSFVFSFVCLSRLHSNVVLSPYLGRTLRYEKAGRGRPARALETDPSRCRELGIVRFVALTNRRMASPTDHCPCCARQVCIAQQRGPLGGLRFLFAPHWASDGALALHRPLRHRHPKFVVAWCCLVLDP